MAALATHPVAGSTVPSPGSSLIVGENLDAGASYVVASKVTVTGLGLAPGLSDTECWMIKSTNGVETTVDAASGTTTDPTALVTLPLMGGITAPVGGPTTVILRCTPDTGTYGNIALTAIKVNVLISPFIP